MGAFSEPSSRVGEAWRSASEAWRAEERRSLDAFISELRAVERETGVPAPRRPRLRPAATIV